MMFYFLFTQKNGANSYGKFAPFWVDNVLLQCLLFQLLHIIVDVSQLIGDADVLRAVGLTYAAADAVRCLSFWLHYAVVADEETAAGFHKVGVLR